jgi:hypothetical protein
MANLHQNRAWRKLCFTLIVASSSGFQIVPASVELVSGQQLRARKRS